MYRNLQRQNSFGPSTLSVAACLAALCVAGQARAQSTIREPGLRPHYAVELEPHLLVSPFDAPGLQTNDGYGVGARATIEILPEGFLPKLNDSVGIGFGLDWLHYDAAQFRGGCQRFVPTAQGVPVCVQTDGGSANFLFVPVVMQWNFWLHPKWSVFGEPGLALSHRSDGGFGLSPVLSVGGRFHIADSVALTLRLGYPTVSLGVSLLL